ncbi:MAG: LPS export ABC transporter periplasmic protein LptC [Ignavibacteriaceae bacterium]|nr:LPS export ABC transporter periplasmic protein LptC [Ignavibacteriaceae bacterium]
MILKFIYTFLFFSIMGFAQKAGSEYITVTGDSLVGKILNGETVREVYGKVVLTQGNIKITCNKAIQFIVRNDAELIGNVVVTQENLTITTERGFYYGNLKKAETKSKVKLDDKKVILTADIGDYYFNEDRAYFKNNVKLYDTATTLTSNELNYYQNENRAVATTNVKIVDAENVITADTVEHFRSTRVTIAKSRVKISNNKNNIVIFGNHLEDYAKKKYTIVNLNPVLIQIDTSYTTQNDSLTSGGIEDSIAMVIDTLVISALAMESFRDTSNIFIARDSVEIVRGSFASKNAHTIYYKDEDKIATMKMSEGRPQPIMWYENSQITGDSILIYLNESRVKLVEITKQAFIHSHQDLFHNRFDQVSGNKINVEFVNGEIKKTDIYGSVYAIYYLYDDNNPNGLTKSSSQSAEIKFTDKQVSEVRLFGSPTSDYYPENMVEDREREYLLPQFILFDSVPNKNQLLKSITNQIKENF